MCGMKAIMIRPKSPARALLKRTKRGPALCESKLLDIRNVLIPTDFSQPSLDAIEFALPLIKLFGANLHFAHVVPADYPLSSLVDLPIVLPEVEIGHRVRRRLKDAAEKFSVELRPENIHALRGSPFEEICRRARDIDIDLIVTSTRGQTGLTHLLLGSTAERIVRYSPCPVLVARPDNSKPGNGKFPQGQIGSRKILVPIDFSEPSKNGLAFATKVARQFKSRLLLLHSVNLEYYVASDEYARYDFPQVLRETEQAARQQLNDLVRKGDWAGTEVEALLKIGHAGQQICAGAKDFGADLIITSTHGRTGFKHVLLGSTAEYVVRHAPCSVLVVPAHPRPQLISKKTKT
jgi:nucleotide-binding universal stress UspA family protein